MSTLQAVYCLVEIGSKGKVPVAHFMGHLPKSSTSQKKLSENHYKNMYLGYLTSTTLWDERFLYKSTCNSCSNQLYYRILDVVLLLFVKFNIIYYICQLLVI